MKWLIVLFVLAIILVSVVACGSYWDDDPWYVSPVSSPLAGPEPEPVPVFHFPKLECNWLEGCLLSYD
jgi:hypothetical protein